MRVQCESCQLAYAIDERKLSSDVVRARCPRCSHVQAVSVPFLESSDSGTLQVGRVLGSFRRARPRRWGGYVVAALILAVAIFAFVNRHALRAVVATQTPGASSSPE